MGLLSFHFIGVNIYYHQTLTEMNVQAHKYIGDSLKPHCRRWIYLLSSMGGLLQSENNQNVFDAICLFVFHCIQCIHT